MIEPPRAPNTLVSVNGPLIEEHNGSSIDKE